MSIPFTSQRYYLAESLKQIVCTLIDLGELAWQPGSWNSLAHVRTTALEHTTSLTASTGQHHAGDRTLRLANGLLPVFSQDSLASPIKHQESLEGPREMHLVVGSIPHRLQLAVYEAAFGFALCETTYTPSSSLLSSSVLI